MQFIFSGNWLPVSAYIRIQTSSRWQHCGLLVGEEVLEARMLQGVHVSSLEDFKKRGKWAIVEVPVEDEAAALAYAYAQIGKSYDFTGLFAFFFNQRKWDDPDKWYCSEYLAAIVKAGGTPIIRETIAGASPRDLWVQNFRLIDTNVKVLIPAINPL